MEAEHNNNHTEKRIPLKKCQNNWKQKLRDNCFKRIQSDRSQLLWKMRNSSPSHKEVMDLTFRNIMSDELKKIKDSSVSGEIVDDPIWEYDGLQNKSEFPESDREEIMLEMQRIFYEDLRAEESRREEEDYEEILEEEDSYLAAAVFEQLQLSTDGISKKEVWCPICKRGELKEDIHHIYCTLCKFHLSKGDEVDLDILQARLAEATMDHLGRGCRVAPKYCMETKFSLTAIYIHCEKCNTFDIVL
ncbi:hypothetical protein ACHQM5_017848 [Ranunculus cassubicifolius]